MTTTAPSIITPRDLARILSRSGIYHLSASSLQTLCELRASGSDSLSMTRLSRCLGVSSAAVTSIVDALDAKGYATRQPSRTDRRVIWVLLTDKGRTALDDILNA